MPKVGKGKGAKEYSYTPQGIAAAKKEAAKTGMPMKMTKPMKDMMKDKKK